MAFKLENNALSVSIGVRGGREIRNVSSWY